MGIEMALLIIAWSACGVVPALLYCKLLGMFDDKPVGWVIGFLLMFCATWIGPLGGLIFGLPLLFAGWKEIKASW